MRYDDDWTSEQERLFAWLNGRCALLATATVLLALIAGVI